MTIQEYIENVGKRFASGITTENSFRGDLQTLIESLVPGVMATNEPKRINCGAPDYVLTRKNIPIGYIEAKDVGADLSSSAYKEQFDRYSKALDNLAFTDYLEFRFFAAGQPAGSPLKIGEIQSGKVIPLTQNFEAFTARIREFAHRTTQTIKGSQRLAEMMADKAKILAYTIREALTSDEQSDENTELRQQMAAFKEILIHDLDAKQFADVYAQTIVYGMFAARLHDKSLDTFTRQEAAELIPKTNPFLRKLFHHIAGYDLDRRIDWIVDDLADLFRATDIRAVLKNYGKTRASEDPIMHFYETFLAEYDPKLRKARGVYYTPEPVVDFIVRAVDDILKAEFGLPAGLADTSKVKVKVPTTVKDARTASGYKEEEKEFHKVQILDPATGTGTFLAQVIKQIYKKFESQKGAWPTYVENDLIPRLNGFELLMASYAMAHLKLDLLLEETGYTRESAKRFQIYLTNALEEHHPDTGKLWEIWLANEANEANHIKRDTPVMAVIGNPPYSSVSTNMGKWISELIENYKYVDNEHFGERKHWLHDDYVKFVRFGQHLVEKNGEGILAYINNNGFLDNPTFRGMRWQILNAFDKIYVINLHGNSKKSEVSPDGSKDENVFDITAGVSINLFIRTLGSKSLAEIYYLDLWGKRERKYASLLETNLQTAAFRKLQPDKPYYFFVPIDLDGSDDFATGFAVNDVFPNNKTGIVTMGDSFILAESKEELKNRILDFLERDYTEAELTAKYDLGKNYANWIVGNKSSIVVRDGDFVPFDYRPFDTRWTLFSNQVIWRWRYETSRHFIAGENVGLVIPKINKEDNCVFITSHVMSHKLCSAYDSNSSFPLYLYPDSDQPTLDGRAIRVPNLNIEIVEKMAARIGLTFVAESTGAQASLPARRDSVSEASAAASVTPEEPALAGKMPALQSFAPIDILDYIYAVLHSPAYREKYKEFLKIDFPRVPYPKNAETFWQLVALGGELRQIHLLESPVVEKFITGYPVGGNNVVDKAAYRGGLLSGESGDVFINSTQYFSNVPRQAWDFYIGGYQPAQKWLKDRKGRTLTFEDIQHYQRIVVALTETDRLMKEIDKVGYL